MTSVRMMKALKSGVAALVSAALFMTSTVSPVAAQTFRAGVAAESGSTARGVYAPTMATGVAALPVNVLGSASLTPSLSPEYHYSAQPIYRNRPRLYGSLISINRD